MSLHDIQKEKTDNLSIIPKSSESAKIQRDIDIFLANGGEIKVYEYMSKDSFNYQALTGEQKFERTYLARNG